jgi:hypothetical protein
MVYLCMRADNKLASYRCIYRSLSITGLVWTAGSFETPSNNYVMVVSVWTDVGRRSVRGVSAR